MDPIAHKTRNDLIMHVLIQWLAYKGVLNEWMISILEDCDNSETQLIRKANYLRDEYHHAMTNCFSWSFSPYSTMGWVELHREWQSIASKIDHHLKTL